MAKEPTRDFCIPEMTQAIFYPMVLDDAVELRVTSGVVAGAMAPILKMPSSPPFESSKGLRVSSSLSSIPPSIFDPLSRHERRMAKTKMTAQLRSPDELLAEGTSEGNPRSSSSSHRLSAKVEVESTSTSSFLEGEISSSGSAMLKKRCRAREEPVQEVVAEGMVRAAQVNLYWPRIHIGSLGPKGSQRNGGPQVSKRGQTYHRLNLAMPRQSKLLSSQAISQGGMAQAPSLVPHGKKAMVRSLNLPHFNSRKQPRAEGRFYGLCSDPLRAGASPSKSRAVEEVDRHPRSVGRPASNEGRGSPASGGSRGDQRSSSQAVGEPSVHTRALCADFVTVDASTKRTLVEKLAKSWSLAPADEEQVAIADVRLGLCLSVEDSKVEPVCFGGTDSRPQERRRRPWLAKKKELEHQLAEARSKAEAEAEKSANVEDRGYRRGRDKSAEFFRELLVTLAPQVFRIEGYFEASSRIAIMPRPRVLWVEFNPPIAIKKGLGNKETTTLGSEATMPDEEDDAVGAAEGSDHDEDPDA
ncbi:LOW QUALITY PROTEIN: hypothetical protein Cgig2_026606 [Carnegiea gigantea]|uniref:Uncharacterized protein n=1 Tax=Carnegiea gigantea TaxID=171969 RepID=A0A9Q1QJD0_9CARY|nr:LOW QUALITY PROTEIN: hypothetical protein Cgig2_026606 [Carnegiea gigantea]